MARTALHPQDPEIASLARAAPGGARHAAFFAARAALTNTPVTDPPVLAVLAALDKDDFATASSARPVLESLVERFDEAYRHAAGAAESPPEAGLASFSKARAVNALLCALHPDPVAAAVDAIYEACACFSEPDADVFLVRAKDVLRGHALP